MVSFAAQLRSRQRHFKAAQVAKVGSDVRAYARSTPESLIQQE